MQNICVSNTIMYLPQIPKCICFKMITEWRLGRSKAPPERCRWTFVRSALHVYAQRSSLFCVLHLFLYLCFLCGSRKATLRCNTSICDSILLLESPCSLVGPLVRYQKISHRISQCIYDANIITNV